VIDRLILQLAARTELPTSKIVALEEFPAMGVIYLACGFYDEHFIILAEEANNPVEVWAESELELLEELAQLFQVFSTKLQNELLSLVVPCVHQ
jgi:hypothetical protein